MIYLTQYWLFGVRVGFLTGLIIFQNKNSFNKVHKAWVFYGQIALFCMQKNERKAFIDSSHLKILCLANDRLTLTVFILCSSHVHCVFKSLWCLIHSKPLLFCCDSPGYLFTAPLGTSNLTLETSSLRLYFCPGWRAHDRQVALVHWHRWVGLSE